MKVEGEGKTIKSGKKEKRQKGREAKRKSGVKKRRERKIEEKRERINRKLWCFANHPPHVPKNCP